MKSLFAYTIVLSFVFLSCDPSEPTTPTSTELKLNLVSVIQGKSVVINQYFPLKNGDSILVSRLDYYMENIQISNKNKASITLDTILFYSLFKDNNTVSLKNFSITNNTIDSLKFLSGLTDFSNAKDPTSFPETHPLSSWNNMYWGAWSKYRFVVFEGNIKKSDGNLVQFTYHTGLEYRNITHIAIPSTYVLSSTPLTIKLNIEKVFYPASGNNINYLSGETTAHSTTSDAELSSKVAENVAKAFTLE